MIADVKFSHILFLFTFSLFESYNILWIKMNLGYWTNIGPFETKRLKSKRKGSIEMKQWANIFKYLYSLENASNGVLLSTVAGMRIYSFTKKWLHQSCFFVNFVKFYRTWFLKKIVGEILLISSNILDVSFVLLAINQLIV